MILLFVFAFISGLVTIFAPCIWPLLPVILSSSASGSKKKPLGLSLGIIISFGFLTLSISYMVRFLHLDPQILRLSAVIILLYFGLSLVIPKLSTLTETVIAKISSLLSKSVTITRGGFWEGFLTGISLGVVWTPCAGPILATIIALSITQKISIQLVFLTFFYLMGVGIPLFIFASASNRFYSKSRLLTKYTGRVQRVFGIIIILTAIAIYTNYNVILQEKLLTAFPIFSSFVNQLEENQFVISGLKQIKKKQTINIQPVSEAVNPVENYQKSLSQNPSLSLPNLGPAPDFVGITKWLNIDKPLTVASLKGKVVLVDFWTYTCINCIRTLPFVTNWYNKYQNQGFIVVGVHTPEFEFEKDTKNVENAIKQYDIKYPVAQDNNYDTWNNYNNNYWPAEYLIDREGNIRRVHFGEGEYDQTETAIRDILESNGQKISLPLSIIKDQTPEGILTPETYLGEGRMERFASPENVKEGKQTFTIPQNLPDNNFAYGGLWNIQTEYAQTAGENSSLAFSFYAQKVFLVITPAEKGDMIKVFLDGKPIPQTLSGQDVKDGSVTLDLDRLYGLVDLKHKNESHILKLQFENKGIKVFAFTFG
ncbi:redoxin domain-containing protein [Patescibacteria group bacterium]|nr:redoxin domain-containing protein [Patescibacteria group bacterium]MCL5798367.1 redoxin domain-containing protein [Patescibacteria group bacterium]